MPKNIDIDPNKIFAKDFLKSTELPIHPVSYTHLTLPTTTPV